MKLIVNFFSLMLFRCSKNVVTMDVLAFEIEALFYLPFSSSVTSFFFTSLTRSLSLSNLWSSFEGNLCSVLSNTCNWSTLPSMMSKLAGENSPPQAILIYTGFQSGKTSMNVKFGLFEDKIWNFSASVATIYLSSFLNCLMVSEFFFSISRGFTLLPSFSFCYILSKILFFISSLIFSFFS